MQVQEEDTKKQTFIKGLGCRIQVCGKEGRVLGSGTGVGDGAEEGQSEGSTQQSPPAHRRRHGSGQEDRH